jgi:hypothetical protein
MMARLMVIVGATGAQGGSVVEAFLKRDDYKLRGITRNAKSEKAKRLASKGVEMVTADINDEASLVSAFEVSLFTRRDGRTITWRASPCTKGNSESAHLEKRTGPQTLTPINTPPGRIRHIRPDGLLGALRRAGPRRRQGPRGPAGAQPRAGGVADAYARALPLEHTGGRQGGVRRQVHRAAL